MKDLLEKNLQTQKNTADVASGALGAVGAGAAAVIGGGAAVLSAPVLGAAALGSAAVYGLKKFLFG